MTKRFYAGAAALIISAGLAGSARLQAASAPPPITLKSTSVELPTSDRTFPSGPGVETVSNNCVACHSAGMILNQPALSKTAWEGEVRKMISVYKAPVSEADVPTIVTYLAHTKGTP